MKKEKPNARCVMCVRNNVCVCVCVTIIMVRDAFGVFQPEIVSPASSRAEARDKNRFSEPPL